MSKVFFRKFGQIAGKEKKVLLQVQSICESSSIHSVLYWPCSVQSHDNFLAVSHTTKSSYINQTTD